MNENRVMDDEEFESIMAQAKAHDRSVAAGKKRARAAEPVTEQGQMQKKIEEGIAPCNKGFKLLQQLGFSGTIGKTNARAQDPLPIVQRARHEGLGADSEAKRVVRELRTAEQLTEEQYVARQAALKQNAFRRRLLRAASKICRELDEKSGLVVEEAHVAGDAEEGREDADEEEMQPDVEGELQQVVARLRQVHRYCFYCAALFESEEDLRDNCPGSEEADH